MNTNDLNTALYEKMAAEQDKFLSLIHILSRMTPIRSPSCGRTPYSFCPPGWYIPSTGQSAKNSSSSCFGQKMCIRDSPHTVQEENRGAETGPGYQGSDFG